MMAQTEKIKLDSGDRFPEIEVSLTDGTITTLPDMMAGQWSMVLVYRGRW